MENQPFGRYKYNCGKSISVKSVAIIILLLVSVITLAIVFSALFLLLLPLPVILLAREYKRLGNEIVITSRYLVVGDQIIYYRNVVSYSRNDLQRTLAIRTEDGSETFICAEKFPTDARKKHKIVANTTAKFNKVSEKLVRHLTEVAPHVLH